MRNLNQHKRQDHAMHSLGISEQWFNELQKYDKVQLSFNNTSKQDQQARIWGANQGIEIGLQEQSFSTDNYPQVIAFNSYNNYYYIANQLAGSLEVFETSGQLVKRIQLEPDFVGFASLVDVTFDESTGSAFAIGSISNTLYCIDKNLELVKSIQVTNRPISVEFNTRTNLVHIAHLTDATVSIINPLLETTELIAVENEPKDIAINQSTGHWFVINAASNSLSLFDEENQNLGVVESIGSNPSKVILSESNIAIVIAADSKEVYIVDLDSKTVQAKEELSGTPVDLHLLFDNSFMVITKQPNELIVYGLGLNEISSQEIEFTHSGTALDVDSNTILIPNPNSNSVTIVAIDGSSDPITASDNYIEVLRDFQHKPVLVKHLKVHFSGQQIAPFIRIGTKSSSGKTVSHLVSMNKYRSPQHFAPIYELTEFENEIIDGKTFWEVLIPPEQNITMVLYYK